MVGLWVGHHVKGMRGGNVGSGGRLMRTYNLRLAMVGISGSRLVVVVDGAVATGIWGALAGAGALAICCCCWNVKSALYMILLCTTPRNSMNCKKNSTPAVG